MGLTTFLTIVIGGVALVWLSRHAQIAKAHRVLPPLTSASYPAPLGAAEGWPRISVLVAAKDEEANIEACAASWLMQDYPSFELIVINDRSGDATGKIIDRLAAGDSRLTALHVQSLREGWFGKNNAMREGAERAGGEWLCFSDADCVQTSPRTLAIALRYARELGADFLSILPVLEIRGLWERILQPACGAIMMLWFNPLKVNDPRHRAAYANGAFMLMSREAYQRLGGHEPFKTEVNEDMHMARRAKQIGLSLRVVSNTDLYRVRMYNSFAQSWRGWSRIFYGCFGTYGKLLASLAVVCVMSLLPWAVFLLLGAARGLGASLAGPTSTLFWTAAVAIVLQLSVMFRFYRLSQINPMLAVTYPAGAVVAAGMLISAIRRLGGRHTTTWRGTTYRADKVEGAAGAAPAPNQPASGPPA